MGSFWWGLIAGVGGTWAYHKFIHPLPGGSANG